MFAFDNEGYGHLVPARIRPADHATVDDIRMFDQHALDLGGVDVLAAGDDQIILALQHPEIAVVIAPGDVPGMVPAVLQRVPRRVRISPIFGEHVGTADDDLTGRAYGGCVAVAVDDSSLTAQARQAG